MEIALQKLRGIELIGATAEALTAGQAGIDFCHFLLPGFGEPGGGGSAAEHQGHTGGIVDLDAGGAGHTVATATAELTCKFLSFFFNKRFPLVIHDGRIFVIR